MAARLCDEDTSYWIADTFVSAFLLYPAMVFYWRGIWDLVGVYIFPDDELKNCWTIFGMGCGTIFGYIFHPLVEKALQFQNRKIKFVVTRVYMAVYAVMPMAYWRGVWTLAEYYLLEYGWKVALGNYFIIEVLLHAFRVRQTAIFPPMFVPLDTRPDVLTPGTRFKVKPGLSWKYALDAVFSHFFALTLTIWLWQSAWECVNIAMSSLDYTLTNFICLGVGYFAVFVVLFLDPVFLRAARAIARRHEASSPRGRFLALLAWEDFVYLVAFWAHLFLWRGCWNLNAEFIIVDPEVGGWVNNLVGTAAFLILQVYSYVGFCGCAVDGWLDGTQDRVFQTHYTRAVVEYFTRNRRSDIVGKESTEDGTGVENLGYSDTKSGVYTISYDSKVSALESRLWSSLTAGVKPSNSSGDGEPGFDNLGFELNVDIENFDRNN